MPACPLLLAQNVVEVSSPDAGFHWAFIFNPAVIWVFIPIVAILGGIVAKIIQRTQEHRERMAMIAAGMHPDHPLEEDPFEDDGDYLRETAPYAGS